MRLAAVAGLLSALLVANAVYAGELSAGIKLATNLDGLLGRSDIRTDPATVTGIGYVHPMQIDIGGLGGDFLGIGTAKGVGVASCANDYDPLWTVYRDGELGGIYHCYDIAVDVYGVGGTPLFELRRTVCSNGNTRWVLYWNSVEKACLYSASASASAVSVVLETTGPGTTDRDIDVKYYNLYKNFTGSGTWYAFGNCDFSPPSYKADFYSLDGLSDYRCHLWLDPMA